MVHAEVAGVGLWCRAEATDVANAVLDGVDGMLLGAETLRGRYAVETVRTVLSICRQAELAFDYEEHFEHMITSAMDVRHHPHRFTIKCSSLQRAL